MAGVVGRALPDVHLGGGGLGRGALSELGVRHGTGTGLDGLRALACDPLALVGVPDVRGDDLGAGLGDGLALAGLVTVLPLRVGHLVVRLGAGAVLDLVGGHRSGLGLGGVDGGACDPLALVGVPDVRGDDLGAGLGDGLALAGLVTVLPLRVGHLVVRLGRLLAGRGRALVDLGPPLLEVGVVPGLDDDLVRVGHVLVADVDGLGVRRAEARVDDRLAVDDDLDGVDALGVVLRQAQVERLAVLLEVRHVGRGRGGRESTDAEAEEQRDQRRERERTRGSRASADWAAWAAGRAWTWVSLRSCPFGRVEFCHITS